MYEEKEKKFTHIAIEKETQRRIAILAAVQQVRIYDLVRRLIDQEWNEALKSGDENYAKFKSDFLECVVVNGNGLHLVDQQAAPPSACSDSPSGTGAGVASQPTDQVQSRNE